MMMKHLAKPMLILTLVFALVLCGCAVEPETFTKDGMSITLTNRFTEKEQAGYTVAYDSSKVAVLALKESFTTLEAAGLNSQSTVADYADVVIANNQMSDTDVQTKDGLTYFTYESDASGQTYSYIAAVYKADDAFWLIQFACLKSDYAEQEADMFTYAKSVTLQS
ncbi:MAG: hypothetical protein IJW55_06435 [Clostridia bacterium]|nr:hypothetical protein [Clostridia bacterium]